MRFRRAALLSPILLFLFFSSTAAIDQQITSGQSLSRLYSALKDEEKFKTLPAKSLISGVPFISWNEAAHLDYERKDVSNPSIAASVGMILKYWGQDIDLLKDSKTALPEGLGGWGLTGSGFAWDINEIKPYIVREIPVIVSTAIAPDAHPMNPLFPAVAAAKGFKIKQKGGQASGVLGNMEPFEAFLELRNLLKMEFMPLEPLFHSCRVVIGYDDERKILILHDPTFGPAWEVSYSDFEKMWKYTDNWYSSAFPADYDTISSKHVPAPSYSSRTPDQKAAAHYIFAYALSSVGKKDMAEEEIRKGLAITDIGKGYKHLLELELAIIYLYKGNDEEAIISAQKAAELLPQHFRPWDVMFAAYKAIPGTDNKEKAWNMKKKADDLLKCSKATEVKGRYEVAIMEQRNYLEPQKAVAETLARDFFIVSGCRNTTVLWLLGPPSD